MPAFELRTLGAVDLRHCSGGRKPSVLAQPKRIALLAYLAVARPRGYHRRDSLLAIFWPDLDERRARSALSQSLHVLRQGLGDSLMRRMGPQMVGVDEDVLGCDVLRFEALLAAGRPGEALRLYRGDLLPGLFVAGSIAFEQWLDLERTRLRRMARDAAHRAAAESRESGSPGTALAVLHRSLELFPTDEGLFQRLIEMLRASGDRMAVQNAWAAFRHRHLEDVGVEPSSETTALAVQARKESVAPSPGEDTVTRIGDGAVRSIAVLPLRDLGPDAGSYSGDGMTEALITELGRVRALRVISHQSVLRFRDSPLGLREIGDVLGVDAIIEGSVLAVGGRVRVTAQLVRVEPEEHLWSDAFEADARDIISVHRDVARAVARAAFAALSSEEERELAHHEPVDPAAYEAFLQGWIKHSSVVPRDMAEAIVLYERAITLDPTFAPPRANLANMYFGLLCSGELPLDVVPTMLETVDLALELDPAAALGYGARGLARMTTHDWYGAEEDLVRAVELAPSSAQMHTHLVFFLTGMGRFTEAAHAAQRSRRLDPLAPHAQWIGAWTHHYGGRAREATRQLQHVLDLFPDYPMAWIFLAKCQYQMGDREATIRACQRSLDLTGENPMTLAYAVHMLAQVAERDQAEAAMAELDRQRTVRGFHSCYYAAVALCGLGRTDEALEEIDKIDAAASTNGWLLRVDPLLDPLRGERRFTDVLHRIGLSEI